MNFWRTVWLLVLTIIAVGCIDAYLSVVRAGEPREIMMARRCMYLAINAEAIQTIRNGGFDPVTGERVPPAQNYETYLQNIAPLAEGNPVRMRDLRDLGAWVYANVPETLDPVNAAFIAGNDCIQRSVKFTRPPDLEPLKEPINDEPQAPQTP